MTTGKREIRRKTTNQGGVSAEPVAYNARVHIMTTSRDRWATVDRLYHAALAQPVARRAAFLVEACAGDEDLHREVESLLAQDAQNVLTRGAVVAAAELVSDAGRSVLSGRLGAYQILAPIGAGGMGEVYRARDTRLGREVAIKILPRAFTADADRLARFEREARVLASLNHPHIGAIHGLEDTPVDGGAPVRALILELVDGETLKERIARGGSKGLPLKETLDIARQIADALDAAHEKGIVHRDLKPANIKITPQGVVKVLDFGLAKLEAGRPGEAGGPSAEVTDAPTITVNDTREGLVVGTAAYMSPEQARGQTVDKRTDIWAFGCLLYEMLTGRQAFGGPTTSDTIAAVIERSPDWNQLPATTPATVRRLLEQSLCKDQKHRLGAIAEARQELADALQWPTYGIAPAWMNRRVALATAIAAIVVASVVSVTLRRVGDSRAPESSTIDSIAVLPFNNANGDAEHEYVASIVGDQVGVDLGSIAALIVLSGAATEPYRGSTKSVSQIGRELRVASLLQGSTVVVGNTARVTVRLIDSNSQRQLWATTYEDQLTNLLTASRTIARTVATQIDAALTPNERQQLARTQQPVDPMVLSLLDASRPQESRSVPDFHERRKYIDRSIQLAPNHAPAYVQLAEWYVVGLNQSLIGPPTDIHAAERKALATALKLDATVEGVQNTLGNLAMIADWDWAGASSYYSRAIELHPNSAAAHFGMRYFRTVTARHDEALTELAKFHRLNPTGPQYYDVLAWAYLSARRYNEVGRALDLERATDIDFPPHRAAMKFRAVADAMSGRAPAARTACDALTRSDEPRMLSLCGFVFGRIGDRGKAQEILNKLVRRAAAGEYVDPFLIASVYAGLRQPNDMFTWLNKAADEHSGLIIELDTAPWYDAYHDDTRYQQLVRRIGFPQYASHQRARSPS
jgi:serine/threonine protein kinase/tetratricopeptide (TPR) repeat protein